MGRVDGEVASITGGGRREGRAHGVRLAEEGADVVLVDACENLPTAGNPMHGGAQWSMAGTGAG